MSAAKKHKRVVLSLEQKLEVGIANNSLVPRLSKGGGGKESLVHTVCACVKLCTRLARAMTFYDVLVTFDRVLTSALTDF